MFLLLLIMLYLGGLSFMMIGSWAKVTCPDTRVNFFLYTEENRETPHLVEPNQDAILRSKFKPEKANKILIHGLYSNIFRELQEIKDAYFSAKNYNIWMVDWEELAAGQYPVVVSRLKLVGTCVAEFIQYLQNVTSTSFQESLHVIGFSLGAHIAAYTAHHLKPYRLPRITGLDPAISFSLNLLHRKLNKKYAQFVDVLHTGALLHGRIVRSGHIDFFVNGGLAQPGCSEAEIPVVCSHCRAVEYFAESITSEIGFWGWPCRSFFHYLMKKCPPQTPTVLMGEYCEKNSAGYYLVTTLSEKPFAIGKSAF